MEVTIPMPEQKDIMRAVQLDKGGASIYGNASKMSKVIKDEAKMLRRTVAVGLIWGTDHGVFKEFCDEMHQRFFKTDITHDVENAVMQKIREIMEETA